MFILRLFITGWVALVPELAGGPLNVIVPNAVERSHFAVLSFDPKDVVSTSGRNDWQGIAQALNGGSDGAGWLLAGERLSIPGRAFLPLALEHSFTSGGARPVTGMGAIPVTEEESWDFTLVPDLGKVASVDGRVDETLISHPTRERVNALLSLTQGYVRTYSLARDLDSGGQDAGDVLALGFSSSGSPPASCAGALAEMIVVEIPVAAQSIRVEAAAFAGGPVSWVTLRPQPGATTVDLLLGNLPKAQRLRADQRLASGHFAHYYELLATAPQAAQRVVPVLCPSVAEPRALAPASVAAVKPPKVYVTTVESSLRGSFARPICTPTVLSP